jgi:hypothetical protein
MNYKYKDMNVPYAIETISDIQQNIKLKKWRRQRLKNNNKTLKLDQVNNSINFVSPRNND